MPDTGLMVSSMTEPPIRYDVTVTVARDGGCGPDPSRFAVAAGQAGRVEQECQRHERAYVAAFSPCPGRRTGCRASRRPRRSGRLRPPAALRVAWPAAGGLRAAGRQ